MTESLEESFRHIARAVLSSMESDGALTQDSESKLWTVRRTDDLPDGTNGD